MSSVLIAALFLSTSVSAQLVSSLLGDLTSFFPSLLESSTQTESASITSASVTSQTSVSSVVTSPVITSATSAASATTSAATTTTSNGAAGQCDLNLSLVGAVMIGVVAQVL
ncbi:hypothetical protein NADFUDRAFT_48780 [Nadsonia fulvescens var. elongata DSM 6958]|uniref:Uncharacterized protein n=1 Tax=Nadsonia fulvescens var. elongata DSM 6958 TaxID=857566 RepID=A0A1E3PRR7_9ASCO|nr:hypothetical protein NADFUDRAFT_48780 [Nadsonia fulvescens var. elongata DSM 6958]